MSTCWLIEEREGREQAGAQPRAGQVALALAGELDFDLGEQAVEGPGQAVAGSSQRSSSSNS